MVQFIKKIKGVIMKKLIKESFSIFKNNFRYVLMLISISLVINMFTSVVVQNQENYFNIFLLNIIIQLFVVIPLFFGIYKSTYNICKDNIEKKIEIFAFFSSPYKITYYLIHILVGLIIIGVALPYFILMSILLALQMLIPIIILFILLIPFIFLLIFIQAKLYFVFYLFFDIEKTNTTNYIKYTLLLTKKHNNLFIKYSIVNYGYILLFTLITVIFTFVYTFNAIIQTPSLANDLNQIYANLMPLILIITTIMTILDYFFKILSYKIYEFIINDTPDKENYDFIEDQLNNSDISILDLEL